MTKLATELAAVDVVTRRVLIPLFMKHAADLGLHFRSPEHLQAALDFCGAIEARRQADGMAKTAEAIPYRPSVVNRRLVTELACNPEIMQAVEILNA